jgi:hypothetical protein
MINFDEVKLTVGPEYGFITKETRTSNSSE